MSCEYKQEEEMLEGRLIHRLNNLQGGTWQVLHAFEGRASRGTTTTTSLNSGNLPVFQTTS